MRYKIIRVHLRLSAFDGRKNALPMEERLSTQVVVTENQRRITVIRA
jgi:hypothetical protein